MSGRSFPALGFDPTPGEVGSVQTVLMAMERARQTIGQTIPRLQEAAQITDDADWGGSAAEEFSDHGDDLPVGLGKGAEALGQAGEALAKWGDQMTANQAKAETLEAKAKQLKKQLAQAEDAVSAAAGAIPRDTTSPQYDAKYSAFLGAVDAAGDLRAQLEQVIADAHRLEAKHLREANAAAEGVRSGPDDAFKPENDSWYVQTLDGVATTSGIISTATGAAAAGLALTGIGVGPAAVLGGISAGTAGLTAVAGVGQRIAGSTNAPSNLSIALDAVPGRTFTSAAVAGVRGFKPAIGSSRLAGGARGAAGGAADGFMSGGLPKFGRDLAETAGNVRRTGSVTDGLKLKAATDGAIQQMKDRRELAGEAFNHAVDTTTKSIEASGGELSPADKQRLEALKFLANPGQAGAENAGVNAVKNHLDGQDKK